MTDKNAATDRHSSPTPCSAVYRVTSLKERSLKFMVHELKAVAGHMDETADWLERCEKFFGLDGGNQKAIELRGAANIAREWADHIHSQNVEARNGERRKPTENTTDDEK